MSQTSFTTKYSHIQVLAPRAAAATCQANIVAQPLSSVSPDNKSGLSLIVFGNVF